MQPDPSPSSWRSKATLTVDECAEVLGVSRGVCYTAVQEGRIPALRFGRRIVIPTARFASEVLGEQPPAPAEHAPFLSVVEAENKEAEGATPSAPERGHGNVHPASS